MNATKTPKGDHHLLTASNNDYRTLSRLLHIDDTPNLAPNVCNPTIIKTCAAGRNANKSTRKLINPAIMKNRKWKVFQTVNNSRIIWDPRAKSRGLLGGHLNIQSIKSKSDQIQHLLTDSNLDFLCLSETWLHEHAPSAALVVPGYVNFRRDRVGSKGGGVMIYVKDNIHCDEIHWNVLV